MTDLATLGIRINSEGLAPAIAELRQLEQIGSRAGAMANALQGQTAGVNRQLAEMERASARTGQALGGMIGYTLTGAITAFGYGVMKAKDQILELAKVAEDNRLRPEFVSGLLGAARGGGATESEITRALEKFSEVSKKAKDDAEAFYKAMSNISPTLTRSFQNAGTQEERLRLVSEALRTTTDEVKRLQLAQEAFGTDSERVLRVLGSGRDALSEYERNARALGMAVDQEMIAKARQADQVLAQLANVISSNLRAALVDLAPVIANAAAALGPLANAASAIISNLLQAQGLATTSVLRGRQSGGASEIARIEAEAEQLGESRRFADTQRVDAINARIAEIRRTLRDVDAELANRGEFADPRDRRAAASEAFHRSGGLAGAPRAFAARPDLTPKKGDDSESSFDRSLRQLQEAAKLQEAQLQTIGLETAERERILALQRAMNVANRDGEELTAAQKKQIEEAAAAYGRMAAQVEKARELQRQLVEWNTTFRDGAKGLLSDFTSNLANGANAWKSFGEAGLRQLQRIGDKLMQMAIDNLWLNAFGGGAGMFGGGGFLGSLFGFGGGGSTGTAILANGGVFEAGGITPFARGGAFTNSIVSKPTLFPFANGTGLMGEAGPEAIMPLRRGPDGRLGVSAPGGGGSVLRMGDTHITIQGNADRDTIAMMKAELDRRDERLKAEMPGVMAKARRDGIAA